MSAPGIQHVLAPNPGPMTLDGTNTWVLGAAHGPAVVVDPGPADAGHLAAIEALCTRGIAEVWLTHHHLDHRESAGELAGRHDAPVRAHDPALCTGEPLADGASVEVGGARLQVLHVPGHTADSLAFVADDALLSGDMVLGRGTTVIMHPDGDLADYFASLERLREVVVRRGVRRVLPGHGPVVADPLGTLEHYVQHRRERLDQVREAMEHGARTATEVVDRVYGDLDPGVRRAAESSAAAQLAYLRR